MPRTSLQSEHPRRLDVPAFTLASLAVLPFGLTSPVVQFSSALKDDSRYSVVGGIAEFWTSGDYLLAFLIFLFSALFPTVKLITLLYLWFVPTVREKRRKKLRIIEPLGKWSMLDVLVVILFAGAVQLGFIADAKVLSGAYVYATAILLSMVAAVLMGFIAGPGPKLSATPRRRSILLPILALMGLGTLMLGLLLPLMKVEKWLFWEEEFSIIVGVFKLLEQGEGLMALAFLVFVIVLPLLLCLSQVLLSLYQLTGFGGGRAVGWLWEFNRWVMTDVFALALFVAVVRLGKWTKVEPMTGIYFFAAAVVISPIVSFWLRRLYRSS